MFIIPLIPLVISWKVWRITDISLEWKLRTALLDHRVQSYCFQSHPPAHCTCDPLLNKWRFSYVMGEGLGQFFFFHGKPRWYDNNQSLCISIPIWLLLVSRIRFFISVGLLPVLQQYVMALRYDVHITGKAFPNLANLESLTCCEIKPISSIITELTAMAKLYVWYFFKLNNTNDTFNCTLILLREDRGNKTLVLTKSPL